MQPTKTAILFNTLAALGALALTAAPARADLVFSLTPSTASPGSSGFFDVDLTDTGSTSYQIGGYSYGLSVPTASGIIFTSDAPDPKYIFAGNSFDAAYGLTLNSTALPAQAFQASDITNTVGSYTTLTAGQTVGLGRVSYSVASGTPTGPVTVSFAPSPTTSLSDAAGNPITAFTTQNGVITVAASAAPEPSQFAMLGGLGIGLGALLLRARRRAAATPRPEA